MSDQAKSYDEKFNEAFKEIFHGAEAPEHDEQNPVSIFLDAMISNAKGDSNV